MLNRHRKNTKKEYKMSKRENVRISKTHHEKLKNLAETERRSMVGQVEYMIDTWEKMLGRRHAREERAHAQTIGGYLDKVLQDMMIGDERVYLADITNRMNETMGLDDSPSHMTTAGVARILRQKGYEITRDGEGRNFIDLEMSNPILVTQ